MFVLLSSSSPFFIIVTSHPIICALQTFLVALSMSLFFDSIIQNYFTGIKIVYINCGFFLSSITNIYLGKHCMRVNIFSEYKKCFGNLLRTTWINASQCEVLTSVNFFTRNWAHNWRVSWKQCVEWSLMFNQFYFYLFIKGGVNV